MKEQKAAPPLNAAQKLTIRKRKGRIRAVQVPGSGKTTVIVARIKGLIESGENPKNLLSLTFTKEAALEMEDRAKLKGSVRVFRTFHSFALDFVTKERENFPYPLEPFPLLLVGQQNKIIGNAIKPHVDLEFDVAKEYISKMKRAGIAPAQAAETSEGQVGDALADAYKRYEKGCRTAGATGAGLLDFDSVIIECVKMLRKPEVRARWKFRHLQVDEAQDNDPMQWEITQLLERDSISFLCVGDPDQNMYEWRGTEAEGLTAKFDERFPGAETIEQFENFRSTPEIVAYLNEICPTEGKVIQATRPSGMPVTFEHFTIDTDEALQVLSVMNDPNHSAIISRTNRGLRPFEDMCMLRGMKYRLLGKAGFWTQEEIKTAMAFIQFMLAPTDNSVMRIIRSPFDFTRGLRKLEIVERLKRMQVERGKVPLHVLLREFKSGDIEQDCILYKMFDMVADVKKEIVGHTAHQAVAHIIERFDMVGYYELSEDHSEQKDNDPMENLAELMKVSARKPTLLEFLAYAQKCATASRFKDGVTLTTGHGAKGKEWKHVFVTGVNDGTVPHKKGTPREEKRIYYVMCSRARDRLQVSCNGVPSGYIRAKLPDPELEIDPAFLEGFEEVAIGGAA